MGMALVQKGWAFDPAQVAWFLVLFTCGTAIAYSFLLLLTSASMWFMRNQSLFEMWWLFTSLMRYPKEIFSRSWAWPLGFFFTFIVPVLLVVNVPARTMVRVFDEKPDALTYMYARGDERNRMPGKPPVRPGAPAFLGGRLGEGDIPHG